MKAKVVMLISSVAHDTMRCFASPPCSRRHHWHTDILNGCWSKNAHTKPFHHSVVGDVTTTVLVTLPETNIAHGKSTILMVFTRKDGKFSMGELLVYQRVLNHQKSSKTYAQVC